MFPTRFLENFIFTTKKDVSAESVLGKYKNRWKIETMYRDMKQHTGFCPYASKKKEQCHQTRNLFNHSIFNPETRNVPKERTNNHRELYKIP